MVACDGQDEADLPAFQERGQSPFSPQASSAVTQVNGTPAVIAG